VRWRAARVVTRYFLRFFFFVPAPTAGIFHQPPSLRNAATTRDGRAVSHHRLDPAKDSGDLSRGATAFGKGARSSESKIRRLRLSSTLAERTATAAVRGHRQRGGMAREPAKNRQFRCQLWARERGRSGCIRHHYGRSRAGGSNIPPRGGLPKRAEAETGCTSSRAWRSRAPGGRK
jgi:hypothetical protein